MKRVNLNNLFESSTPPANTNVLWVDKDESINEIRAIHKYNNLTNTWEPYLVSVNYLKPKEENTSES